MALGKQKPTKAIKGSYILILLEHLQKHYQLDIKSLLTEVGLSYDDLTSRQYFLTTEQYIRLHTAIGSKMNVHDCVFEIIPDLEVTQHGIMGLLIMCGLTLNHALKAFLKFYRLQSNLITFEIVEQDDKVYLTMIPLPNLGEVEKFTIQMCMASFYKTKQQLLGQYDCTDRVCFTYNNDLEDAKDNEFYNCQVLYNQPDYEIVFPKEQLHIKLKSASQTTFDVLKEQCEQSLAVVKQGGDIITEIQQYLRQLQSLTVSLKEVADHFATSTRTLSRYLQQAGTSFQALLDNERIRRAKDLLIYTDLNLTDIAHQLGFSDSSHFTKVFKRETNELPSKFRKEDASN